MNTMNAPTTKFNFANVLNRRVATGFAIAAVGAVGLSGCGTAEPGVHNDNIPAGYVPDQAPYENALGQVQLDLTKLSGAEEAGSDASCGDMVAKAVGGEDNVEVRSFFTTTPPNKASCIYEGGDELSMIDQASKFSLKLVAANDSFEEAASERSVADEIPVTTTEESPAPNTPPVSTNMPENGIPGTQKELPPN